MALTNVPPTDPKKYEVDMTDRQLLLYIAATLDRVESRLSTLDDRVDALNTFTNGIVEAVEAAKSGGGMGGMMAKMLPPLPAFIK